MELGALKLLHDTQKIQRTFRVVLPQVKLIKTKALRTGQKFVYSVNSPILLLIARFNCLGDMYGFMYARIVHK